VDFFCSGLVVVVLFVGGLSFLSRGGAFGFFVYFAVFLFFGWVLSCLLRPLPVAYFPFKVSNTLLDELFSFFPVRFGTSLRLVFYHSLFKIIDRLLLRVALGGAPSLCSCFLLMYFSPLVLEDFLSL